jgi:hypothetical protein
MLVQAAQTAYRRNAALLEVAQRTVARQRTTEAQAVEIVRHQALAARLAVQTSAAVLAEQDVTVAGATVVPTSFTADPSVVRSLIEDAGRLSLTALTQVLVGDAGKSAGGAYTASRAVEVGYVRYLVGASCDRCAILAGRWYRWSDGFLRHPNCDCIHLPANRAASTDLVSSPAEAFDAGLVHGLSKAQEQAIRDGADIGQVVNAKRGMRMVNFAGRRVQTTTAGAGRGVRLTPESIYRLARDRQEAIRLLRAHRYIA